MVTRVLFGRAAGVAVPGRFFASVKSRKLSVLLLDDVSNVGSRGEELQVSKGFARNYLLPKRLAVHANEETRARFLDDGTSGSQQERAQMKRIDRIRKRLSRTTVRVWRQQRAADDDQHAPVTAENVAQKLVKQTGLTVPASALTLESPITHFGTHTVKGTLGDVIVPFKVTVAKRNPNEFDGGLLQ